MMNFHLPPAASERNSEKCSTTTKPNCSLGEDCSVSAKKRKVHTNAESPRKRLRCASGRTQLAVEAVPAKATTRKASSEAIRGTSKKERDGAEQHLTTEVPGTINGKRGCDPSQGSSAPSASTSLPVTTSRARFEAKYLELHKLGQGGYGSVYAGRRKSDSLPVAIKHIPTKMVNYQQVVLHGMTIQVPLEVLLMLRAGGGPLSVGKSAVVSLLDWYDLEQEVVVVMERPDPCVSLLTYVENNSGPLEEDVAKNIMKQLVDAASKMHARQVFHRDIKAENVLIESRSDGLRVRVIDFGCGSMAKATPYRRFSGTAAYAPPEFFTHGCYEAVPTTVWQLGTLLYEMLEGYEQFITSDFIQGRIHFISELSIDCRNFLDLCLAQNPKARPTLEQIQLHPWLQNAAEMTPLTPCDTL